jgi:hypothetical protein
MPTVNRQAATRRVLAAVPQTSVPSPFGGRLIGPPLAAPASRTSKAFGDIPAMSPEEESELRRQQRAFSREAERADIQNSWFAGLTLLPVAAALGLEATAAVGLAPLLRRPGLLDLRHPRRFWPGNNPFAQIGKLADKRLLARVAEKPNWKSQMTITTKKGTVRPDASTPTKNPLDDTARYHLELKPKTPSGRRAAARAVKRTTEITGRKTRAIYYDPEDFM